MRGTFALVSKISTMTLLAFSLKARDFALPPNSGFLFRSFGVPSLARDAPAGLRPLGASLACSGDPSLAQGTPRLSGDAKSLAFRQNASNVPLFKVVFGLYKCIILTQSLRTSGSISPMGHHLENVFDCFQFQLEIAQLFRPSRGWSVEVLRLAI